MWSGAATAIPSGWLLCNGSNGTPDLRNRFIVGAGSLYGVGDTGGSNTVTLTVNEMPSHSHYLGMGNSLTQDPLSVSSNQHYIVNPNSGVYTNSAGGSQAHENRPPYYALCYIMKQ